MNCKSNQCKKLLSFICALIMLFSCVNIIYAEDEQKIIATDDMAIQMAENFSNAIAPDLNLEAFSPQKFYDTSGQAIGYIVNYSKDSSPYGYIIFDSTENNIVTEYSIAPNSINPYEIICQENEISTFSTKDEKKLYKTAPVTYAILDESNGIFIDNYGDETPATASISTLENKPTTEWNEVLFYVTDVNSKYTLNNFKHLGEFTCVSSNVKYVTGHYACAVNAIIAAAMQYGIYEDIYNSYMEVWGISDTFLVEGTPGDDGVYYGETSNSKIGPALVEYCSRNGVSISQSTITNADYSVFTQCIDRGAPAIAALSIIKTSTGDESGHAMTVQGYSTITNKTTGATYRTLLVADGWGETARHLTYDSAAFRTKTGIVCYS